MWLFNLLLKVFYCSFLGFIFVCLPLATLNSLLNVAVSLNTSRSHCSREHGGNILSMQKSHFICVSVNLKFTHCVSVCVCVCVCVYNNLIHGTILCFSSVSWIRNCDQWLRTEPRDSSCLHSSRARVSEDAHPLSTAESF